MGFISKMIGDLPFPKIFKFEETRDPLKYDMLLAKNLNNPTSSLQANILFLRRMINNILQNMNVAWDDKWKDHDRLFKQAQDDTTAKIDQLNNQLTEELKKIKEALSKVAITVKTTKVTSNGIYTLDNVQANSVITIRGYIQSLTGNLDAQNLVITPYIKPLYASGSLDSREITPDAEGPIITYPCPSTRTYIQHSFIKNTDSENVMINFASTSGLELGLEILWAQNTVIN